MDLSTKLSVVVICSIFDIILEYAYQLFLLFSFDNFIDSFALKFRTMLDYDLRNQIKTSVKHTMIHLSVHFALIFTCIALLLILFTVEAKRGIASMVKYGLTAAFPPFFGITSFEVLFLQTLCFIVRYCESRAVWNIFVPETSAFNKLWPVFVFSIVAPIEVRFKIFLEKKLHHKAVVVIAIIDALYTVMIPYLKLFSALNFVNSTVIELDKSLTVNCETFKNAFVVISHAKTHHLNIQTASFLKNNYFLVEGVHNMDISDLSATFLFESYKFSTAYQFYNVLYPILINLTFAGLITYLNRRYIKYLHPEDIDQVTVYLIIEEFLNLGFFKYLKAPFKAVEKILIYRNDSLIKKTIGSSAKILPMLYSFIKQEISRHKNICPSPIFTFVNSDENSLKRAENMLL